MADSLETLLDEIYRSLLSGAFGELPGQSARLERAMAELPPLTRAEARGLREKSMRNERCLSASLSGLQSARIRIREIRKAAAGLTTYDRTGGTALLSLSAAIPKRL